MLLDLVSAVRTADWPLCRKLLYAHWLQTVPALYTPTAEVPWNQTHDDEAISKSIHINTFAKNRNFVIFSHVLWTSDYLMKIKNNEFSMRKNKEACISSLFIFVRVKRHHFSFSSSNCKFTIIRNGESKMARDSKLFYEVYNFLDFSVQTD